MTAGWHGDDDEEGSGDDRADPIAMIFPKR